MRRWITENHLGSRWRRLLYDLSTTGFRENDEFANETPLQFVCRQLSYIRELEKYDPYIVSGGLFTEAKQLLRKCPDSWRMYSAIPRGYEDPSTQDIVTYILQHEDVIMAYWIQGMEDSDRGTLKKKISGSTAVDYEPLMYAISLALSYDTSDQDLPLMYLFGPVFKLFLASGLTSPPTDR